MTQHAKHTTMAQGLRSATMLRCSALLLWPPHCLCGDDTVAILMKPRLARTEASLNEAFRCAAGLKLGPNHCCCCELRLRNQAYLPEAALSFMHCAYMHNAYTTPKLCIISVVLLCIVYNDIVASRACPKHDEVLCDSNIHPWTLGTPPLLG